MDPQDPFNKLPTTGKVRVIHGGRNRAKPYARKKVKKPTEDLQQADAEKGFLGKVTSYIVPRWISSWFSGSKKDKNQEEASSSEDSDDDNEPEHVSGGVISNAITSNHIGQGETIEHMTSTPMVQSRSSFTVLSSDVMDPQEGTSGTNQEDTTIREYEAEMLKTTQSSRVLLSIDDDDDAEGPVQSKEGTKNVNYQFSLGSKPSEAPQRFFTSRTKPSFKVSSFVSTSPLIPCGSSSSFYPGRTSFGGASALQNRSIKRQRVSPVASGLPTKKSNIKPRSMRSGRMGAVTSDTARKILGALEKMSSPIKDASKLPNSPSSILFNPPKRRTDSSLGFLSSTAKRPGQGPPTSLLTTPRTISVQRTDQTSTPFNFTNRFETGNIRPSAPVTTFKSKGLPTSFSPEEDSRAGGKMKRQRQTSHFAAASVTDKEEEPVNTLPEIRNAAPLLVQSLPKFNFGGPSTSSTQATTATKSSAETKAPFTTSKPSLGSFTFSQPEKISSDKGQAGTNVAKSSFQFSKPMSKEKDATETADIEKKDSATKPFEIIASSVVSPILKTAAPSQKLLLVNQPKGWECDTCMIINSTENTSCVACTAPKPVKKDAKVIEAPKQETLADKFKPSVGSWECPACMILNSKDKDTCIACKTTNPSKKEAKAESTNVSKSLKNLFKPAQGSWECDSCMVQNTADKDECVACNTKKPGSSVPTKESAQSSSGAALRMKFGAPADSWDCKECMVPNGGDKSECISCGSKKPGSAPKNAPSVFGEALKNKFAPPEKSWECDTCMVMNKGDATECISCSTPKPGGSTVPKTSAPSFSFGTTGSSSAVMFGAGNTASNSVKFGNTTGGSGFTFGSSSSGGLKFGNSGNIAGTIGTTESKGFAFGNSKDSGKVSFGGATGFSFNAPKDVKVNDTKVEESEVKTEENNNKLAPNAAIVAGSSMFGSPKAMAGSKPSTGPVKAGGISSIAEAAQAGFLRVPGLEQKTSPAKDNLSEPESKQKTPKFSFGAVANGPVTTVMSEGNSIVFSSKNETQDSSAAKPFDFSGNQSVGNSNLFAAKASSEFMISSKASETSTTTNSGFSFGTSSAFSAKPTSAADNQSSQSILSNHGSGFSFGGTNKQMDNSDPPKSDTAPKFSFGQSSAQSAIPSLFDSSKNDKENSTDSQKPFQFSSEPVKSATFGTAQTNSFSNPAGSAENNLLFNSGITATQSPFSFTNSNPEAKSIVFGGDNKTSVLQSTGSNSVFGSSTTSNNLSGGGFSFGSNLTSASSGSIFGSQSTQNAEQNPGLGGFGFAGAPTPSTKLFTDAVSNTPQEKATPFGFNASTSNPASGGFKFSNTDVNSSPFESGTAAPAKAAGTSGFNFTNNQPAASGGFNFTSGTNTGGATMFSSGAPPAAPSGRVIRKAVRRKQR